MAKVRGEYKEEVAGIEYVMMTEDSQYRQTEDGSIRMVENV